MLHIVLVLQRGRTTFRLLIVAAARSGWKPRANPPPSSRVTASNVSDAGAPFGVGVYFEKAQVRGEGASKVYIREVQEGRKVRFRFCPECGTTVYWDLDRRPTILASLSVHSPILLFLRRRDRSGRNLGIRGSPSGIISGISRKRHQSPEPLADLGRQQHRAIVGSGRLSPQRTTASG